jgi:hypothetical protein
VEGVARTSLAEAGLRLPSLGIQHLLRDAVLVLTGVQKRDREWPELGFYVPSKGCGCSILIRRILSPFHRNEPQLPFRINSSRLKERKLFWSRFLPNRIFISGRLAQNRVFFCGGIPGKRPLVCRSASVPIHGIRGSFPTG